MKYCPRCLRTEAQIDTCPNNDFPGMNCPELREEDSRTDITISCGPCDFTRVVPVKELISGVSKNKLPACRRDDCACVVVPPSLPDPMPAEETATQRVVREVLEEEGIIVLQGEKTITPKKAPKLKVNKPDAEPTPLPPTE